MPFDPTFCSFRSHCVNRPSAVRTLTLPFLCALLLALSGCGDDEPNTPKHDIHIRGLWHVLWRYTGSHEGNYPKDAQELKTWAEANINEEQAELLGLHSVSDSFVSPRDGKPYVVLYIAKQNVGPTVYTPESDPTAMRGAIAIHEAEGQDGTRFVAFTTGDAREVSEAEFQKMISKKRN